MLDNESDRDREPPWWLDAGGCWGIGGGWGCRRGEVEVGWYSSWYHRVKSKV